MTNPRMVNVHEAKTHLSRLLERVALGEEIILAKAGKPIARLVPMEQAVRKPGAWKGLITIKPEFYEPWTDEEVWLDGPIEPE